MKTIGLLGGMSWESTVPYYQTINRTVAERLGGLHSAEILLYSVDFREIEAQQRAGRCPLPPGRYPREDERLERAFAAWLSDYESASGPFASCRYIESLGSGGQAPETRALVEEHDRISRALSDLPLA